MPFKPNPFPVVVLTGASSGIGHATALAFAQAGARLVLAARGRDALDVVAAQCRRLGADTLVVPTDVTDAKAVGALADEAAARFGHIDVWINNVGIGAVGRFDETPIAAHRRVIETNLMGQVNGAHAVLPYFRRDGAGVLINMVSAGGWTATPYAAAYAASKFALRGFSEALRAELRDSPQVHVCEVYPTLVDTPGLSHGANYTGRQVRPFPPLVDPHRVAAALVRLSRRPRRSVWIGSLALPARLANALMPDLAARLLKILFDVGLAKSSPARLTTGNLFDPSGDAEVSGGYRRPWQPGALAGAASVGVLALGWWMLRRRSR